MHERELFGGLMHERELFGGRVGAGSLGGEPVTRSVDMRSSAAEGAVRVLFVPFEPVGMRDGAVCGM
jgi:hypothetical protein